MMKLARFKKMHDTTTAKMSFGVRPSFSAQRKQLQFCTHNAMQRFDDNEGHDAAGMPIEDTTGSFKNSWDCQQKLEFIFKESMPILPSSNQLAAALASLFFP